MYRYPNNFGRVSFNNLPSYNVGDQRQRMGWEALQPTPDSTRLLHLALAWNWITSHQWRKAEIQNQYLLYVLLLELSLSLTSLKCFWLEAA